MQTPLQTPVIFVIFNRPKTTEKVFEAIRAVKPVKLLVVADGPRADRPGESEKCAATRAIIDRVDWQCEVLTNYSEVNMGVAKRPATGFDWAFSLVEEAIILEDDCLPHPSFFRFCEELLERHRHDTRIMCISGQNVQLGRSRTPYSYYFSRYNHGWGWATWRRAWQLYDFEMKQWPEIRDGDLLAGILETPKAVKGWTHTFQLSYDQKLPAWDYQFTFACWAANALSILSDVNLISNIGHGEGASNTTDSSSVYSNMAAEAMEFPLRHPPYMMRSAEADTFTEETIFNYQSTLLEKIERRLRKAIAQK